MSFSVLLKNIAQRISSTGFGKHSHLQFEAAFLCEKGGKLNNEDCCEWAESEQIKCWVVADGLGGHRGGQIASEAVCSTIVRAFMETPAATIDQVGKYLALAHEEVVNQQLADVKQREFQSTVVLLVSDGISAVCGHVGDSRLYYFKNKKIVFQTEDHSVPQALVRAGEILPEEIRHHVDRNRLLSSIGGRNTPKYTVHALPFQLAEGDVFLLCTDGFWEYVEEQEMERLLAKAATPAQWLEMMKSIILQATLPNYDNYSGIAIYI